MARTRRKKRRTQGIKTASEVQHLTGERIPKSFVISRGKLPSPLKQLQFDLRKLMLPHTASNLKDKRNNTLKDFVHVAGPLGVSHFLIVSSTEKSAYLRVARCPRGPTLTFEIQDYSLMADITRCHSHPRAPDAIFKTPPLVVLAGFGSGEQQLKLATVMFQNIFPVIDVNTVKLTSCQRVLLLSYNKDTRLIDFRHYSITLQPLGISRRIRKFVQRHEVPDLCDLNDVSEFITKPNYGSESEMEDEASTVKLTKDCGRINKAASQSAVKLHEIGPRMTLKLVKVEEGLCSGGIIFHEYVKKSPEEIRELRESKERREELRKQRRAEQEANVQRKQEAKEALKKRQRKVNNYAGVAAEEENDGDDMDDVDWYREEVGEEPDSEFFAAAQRREDFYKGDYKRKHKNDGGEEIEADKELTKEEPSAKVMDFTKKRSKMEGSSSSSAARADGRGRKFNKIHKNPSVADKILAQKRKAGGGARDKNKRRRT